MAGFIGRYLHSIDEKGRLKIPAHFLRDGGPQEFVLTRGFETCLFLYPKPGWERIEAQLRERQVESSGSRAFVRIFLSWATPAPLDRQGRVIISRQHLEQAKLSKEARVIGALERIEIWNPDLFDEYERRVNEQYEDLAAHVLSRRDT